MTHRDDIQGWLVQLGKAHREVAFSSDAARYPWQTAELQADRPTHRRFAWVRVAVPLAAAAAVAVLFVVPSVFTEPVAEPNVDVVVEAVTPEEPEATIAVASGLTAPSGLSGDFDYNGDGELDGRDIQAYLDWVQRSGGDVGLETERFRDSLL